MINTDSLIGRNEFFQLLGLPPQPAQNSWGEYLPNGNILMQLHTEDAFTVHGRTYVRVLRDSDDRNPQSHYGLKTRIAHVQDLNSGKHGFAIFDKTAKSRTYANYVYKVQGLHQLPTGTYVEVVKRLTVDEYLNQEPSLSMSQLTAGSNLQSNEQ